MEDCRRSDIERPMEASMNIHEVTQQFEQWVGKQVSLDKSDLKKKHAEMASDPFSFLRATYYRWAQVFPKTCSELRSAPKVLAVGDLHVENYGTWRDSWGRLIWGINDFDEAFPLPYRGKVFPAEDSHDCLLYQL